MVDVALDWRRVEWMPDETWVRDTLPKIEAAGLRDGELRRSVYIIRLNGDFCVEYPRGESPTLYIGEGRFGQRIGAHRSWVTGLRELVGDFSFQVCIAIPRVRNNLDAYLDAEAALLERFGERFGSAPLWNKQFERRRNDYNYNRRQIDQAIGKRSGAKYRWSIKPMRSSPFYRNYLRTHIET